MWLFLDEEHGRTHAAPAPAAATPKVASVPLATACGHRPRGQAVHLQWRSKRDSAAENTHLHATTMAADVPVPAASPLAAALPSSPPPVAAPRCSVPSVAPPSPLPPPRTLSPLPPLSPVLAAATAAMHKHSNGRHSPFNARADAAAMTDALRHSPEPAAAATATVAVPSQAAPTIAKTTPPPAHADASDEHAVADAGPLPFVPEEVPAGFQLGFSSGSGKRVQLSTAALKAAEERMRRMQAEDEAAPERALHARPSRASAAPAAATAAAATTKVAAAEETFSPHEQPPAASLPPAGFQLGFSSGAGKRVHVSTAAMKAAQQRMETFLAQAEANDNAAAATMLPLKKPAAAGSATAKRAAAEAAAAPATDDGWSPMPLDSAAAAVPADFQLGFSTGKGSRVSISATALRQAEAKMALDDEEGAATAPPVAASAASLAPVAAASASAAARPRPAAFKPPGRRSTAASLPLLHLDEDGPQERKSQDSSGPPLISAASLIADIDDPMSDVPLPAKPHPLFSEEALARAKAFMEQHDADSPLRAPVIADAVALPLSHDASMHPAISPERIKAAADLMEQFDGTLAMPGDASAGDAASSSPAIAPTPASASGDESGPASKRRRSNFSTVLPLPLEEMTEDTAAEDGHAPQTNLQLQNMQQQPQQPQPSLHLQTPQQPPRPPLPAHSAMTTPRPTPPLPAAPLAPQSTVTRKRRGAAFVSPRVTGRPTLTLTSVPAQTPLLTLNRRSPQPGAAAASSVPFANGGAPSSMSPALAPGLFAPSMPTGPKVSLRDFDERCQQKLIHMQEQGYLQLAHPPCANISPDNVNSRNAAQVLFVPPSGAPVSVDAFGNVQPTAGWLDVRAALLAMGLPSSLCSVAWVRNQYRWVVWKLACYDRRFGAALSEPACCFRRVVAQCYARYEREFNQIKTPAIKKIMEGDEAAGKFLVLLVAQVVLHKSATTANGNSEEVDGAIPVRPGGCVIELSDGHYSVWCKLDAALHGLLQQGKIREGMKLRIWGASLEGPTPTTPLENTSAFMKIAINCVRHARWDAKLGVQQRCAFLVNMASLRPDGGPVPALRVVVSKQYPMVHMHPPTTEDAAAVVQPQQGTADGAAAEPPKLRKLHCNQRAHDVRMAVHQKVCEKRLEKLRRDFEDAQAREKRVPTTVEEMSAEEDAWSRQRAELDAELQDIFKQVVPYLKVHLCEVNNRSYEDGRINAEAPLAWTGQCCLFTVWRPVEEHLELLQPGKELIIYGLSVHARFKPRRKDGANEPSPSSNAEVAFPHHTFTPTASHFLQLSTSRLTNIVPRALARLAGVAAPAHSAIPLRQEFLRHALYLRPGELWSMPRHAEFDAVCVVLSEQQAAEQPELAAGGSVRWQRQRRLLCAGMSGDLLLIEVNESKELLFFAAPVPPLTILSVENLVYQRFEKQLQLHVAASNALTVFKPKGMASFAGKNAPPSIPVSHAAFARPSLPLLQAWLSHPTTTALLGLVDAFSQSIVQGTWNGGQATTFSKDDFAQLLVCPVQGHILPFGTADSIVGIAPTSLAPMLRSFDTAQQAQAQQPSEQPPANGHAEGDSSAPPVIGPTTPSLLKKRSAPSLLAPGSGTKATAHGHVATAHGEDAQIAADCRAVEEAVCVHPSHTLSLLLDAINWHTELCVDDGCGARWPLLLDSHAFRRVLHVSGAVALLHDSWSSLLQTGEVLFPSPTPPSHADTAILTAMAQMRRHVFHQIIVQFDMDEPRQGQQLAEFIMLVLSHSASLPLSSCVESLSVELAHASPAWSSALSSSRHPSPPSASSSNPVLSSELVPSLSDPAAVRVHLSLTGIQQPPPPPSQGNEPAAAMDTSAGGEVQQGHKPAEEEVGQLPLELTAAQLQQLLDRLTERHLGTGSMGESTVGSDPTAATGALSSWPLLFFVSEEWSALCEELCRALRIPSLALELAECERFPATMRMKPHNSSSPAALTPFRSVFIPKREAIRKT